MKVILSSRFVDLGKFPWELSIVSITYRASQHNKPIVVLCNAITSDYGKYFSLYIYICIFMVMFVKYPSSFIYK